MTPIKDRAASILERSLDPIYTIATKEYFKNQTVLVTGAGGSIGSEIVRQLTALGTTRVVCLDRDEYALYRLDLEINRSALLTSEDLVLCDIKDFHHLEQVFREVEPTVVFHAAAVKHLPLLEKSSMSALSVNVIGTKNIAELSALYSVGRLINVSTDKAANPSSVLGYSKKIGEKIANCSNSEKTVVSSVRFGNVFASRGSFMETLQWQAHAHHPIKITDPEATRYFMSIPQAASLVIESALIAEPAHTYVLDMGEPVRILDAVQRYLNMVTSESSIEFTGLRYGEKLHEELYDNGEHRKATSHPKIFSVKADNTSPDYAQKIERLYSKSIQGNLTNELIINELRMMAQDKEDN